MFELAAGLCPSCGYEIRESLKDGQIYDCRSCRSKYHVLLDVDTKRIGLIEVDAPKLQEPLFLPRGSVRAFTTIVLALCCWMLIFNKKFVPGYLFSLLLTLIGYYFGYRKKAKAAESKIIDATAKKQNPLFLPAGIIRVFLIIGFLITGIVLISQKLFTNMVYLEFYLILAGLVIGYIFSGFVNNLQQEAASLLNFINHTKAAVLLVCVVALFILLLIKPSEQNTQIGLWLACFISFYFGSRS